MDFYLYHILSSLCTKAPESLVWRLLYTLHHYYKIPPLHLIALGILVIFRKLEASCLQTLYIHYHTPVLSMEQLHQLAALTDEDEYVTITHVTLHPFMHNTTERADTLSHICSS
jgi:hypothetical protein